MLGLETLEKRRMVTQGMFMFKLLTGRIDAPLLLSHVNLYVPTRPLRTRQFLITDFRYRLFCARDPLLLMSKNFNLFSNFVDRTGVPVLVYRNVLVSFETALRLILGTHSLRHYPNSQLVLYS